ncbi:MAG: hypothetical protein WAM08_03995, partial [Candidatus Acidiferrales bacterium]
LELLNDIVTFTGEVLEFPAVHNLHCTAHVFYDSLFLQYRRCQAHGGPVSTHHGRDEIVGDRKNSQIHPILGHQQPSRETLLYIMESIARRSLCDLHPLKPRMPVQDDLKLRSRPQNAFERVSHDSEAIPADLDYFTHGTSAQANGQSRPNVALIPHYTHFHSSTVFGHYDLRNHSPVRKIDEFDVLSRLMKAEMIRQIDVLQVGTHQLEFIIGRCQQHFVAYWFPIGVGSFARPYDSIAFSTHGTPERHQSAWYSSR